MGASLRVGLYGGTFDPIHIGHLRSVLEVTEMLALDQMRLLPNAVPPHRPQPQVSASHRLAMIECALQGVPRLIADDRELCRNAPSYTIDTLESVRSELPATAQLFLLMGWDAFCSLPSWRRWRALFEHCHILVSQRPELDIELPDELAELPFVRQPVAPLQLSGQAGQVAFIRQTPLAISATQIRQLLKEGRSARFLLPDAVLRYIETHDLYRAE